jgi:hypothetical protein
MPGHIDLLWRRLLISPDLQCCPPLLGFPTSLALCKLQMLHAGVSISVSCPSTQNQHLQIDTPKLLYCTIQLFLLTPPWPTGP